MRSGPVHEARVVSRGLWEQGEGGAMMSGLLDAVSADTWTGLVQKRAFP
jgi:hypothetical protein